MYFICRTNGGAINLEVGSFLLPHTRSLGLGSPSNISQENENRFSPLESIYKTNDSTACLSKLSKYTHSIIFIVKGQLQVKTGTPKGRTG